MPLFADIDWGTVATAVGAALATVLTAVGGLLKLVFNHLRTQQAEQNKVEEVRDKKQQDHEKDILARVDGIAGRFDTSVREFRTEQRQTIDTLLDVTERTVQTVGSLGHEVRQLGTAIAELRGQLAGKMDRPPVLPGPSGITT